MSIVEQLLKGKSISDLTVVEYLGGQKVAHKYGDKVLPYNKEYIIGVIESDDEIFDLRGWRDCKFSLDTLKEWYDQDFPESGFHDKAFVAGNSGHFGYCVRNWKKVGGTWGELRDLFLKVKDKHIASMYRAFYRDYKWCIGNVFEYVLGIDWEDLRGGKSEESMTWSDYSSAKNWIEHARGYVDEINIFADALGKHRLPYPKWIDWNMTQLVGWRNGKYLKELLRIKRLLEIEQKKAQKLGDKYEGFYINVPKEYPEDYWDGSIYLHDLDDFKEHLGKTNKEIENSKVKLLQITGYDKQLKAMQGNMSKVKSILNKPKEPEIDLSHVAELLNRT